MLDFVVIYKVCLNDIYFKNIYFNIFKVNDLVNRPIKVLYVSRIYHLSQSYLKVDFPAKKACPKPCYSIYHRGPIEKMYISQVHYI